MVHLIVETLWQKAVGVHINADSFHPVIAITRDRFDSVIAPEIERLTNELALKDADMLLERDRAEKAEAWKTAVIDALIVNHIYSNEHETNPRKAISDLIAWETKIALDSSVSSDAANLIKLGAKETKAQMAILVEVIKEFPELNPNNFDHEDVLKLNNWGIAVFQEALAKIKEEG